MQRTFLLIIIVCTCILTGCDKSAPPSAAPLEEQPAATQPASVLLPAPQDGKWGYINGEGKFVVRPQYQNALHFSENLAAVRSKGLWGFVNKTGKMVIPPQFQAVDQVGFSASRIAVMRNGKWGLIDTTGKTVIPPTFDVPLRFHENLAVVRKGNLFGYIDPNGKIVIQPQFTFADGFSEGLAAVMLEGQRVGRRVSGGTWGFITKTGKMVIPHQFRSAGSFSEGLAWVQSVQLPKHAQPYDQPISSSYIDTQGQTVIRSKEFLLGREFHENLAAVRMRHTDLWGFIDRSGALVITADYDQVRDFHEGLAAVLTFGPKNNGVKWGYIQPDGEIIISPQFDQADDFQNGLAAVRIDGKLGYINRKGEFLFPPAK